MVGSNETVVGSHDPRENFSPKPGQENQTRQTTTGRLNKLKQGYCRLLDNNIAAQQKLEIGLTEALYKFAIAKTSFNIRC